MRWSPYEDNAGSALAIAGPDFVVAAADSRISSGYSIMSRTVEKWSALTPSTIILTGGQHCDRTALHANLKQQIQHYKFQNADAVPSCEALSARVSTELYAHRMRPLYAFNILIGIDPQGRGAVWNFDIFGCAERLAYTTVGSAQAMMEPYLDSVIRREHMRGGPVPLTVESALAIAKSAMAAAAERDIQTGDTAHLLVLTAAGLRVEHFPLRSD